jgi:hypothetical protein
MDWERNSSCLINHPSDHIIRLDDVSMSFAAAVALPQHPRCDVGYARVSSSKRMTRDEPFSSWLIP